jgi:ABC-type amino acid transport system permease subunit
MVFLQIIRALSAGVLNTLLITFATMAIGLAGGLLLALIHQLSGPRGRRIHRCAVYTTQSIPRWCSFSWPFTAFR